MEMWVSVVGIVVSIVCTLITIYYQVKTKTIKDAVYSRLNDLSLSEYSSRFTSVVNEISRCSNKEGNNRGGKLKSVFDRLTNELLGLSQFSMNFDEKVRKQLLNEKTVVQNFLLENKEKATVDLKELSEKLNRLQEDICKYVELKMQEHKY